MFAKKGCDDGCSFYRVSFKLESLPYEKQIEIERALEDGSLNLGHNHDLLFKSQTSTCIGGLITDGAPRKKCAYFSIHPDQCSEGDLIQYFIASKSARHSIPWKIATLVLGIASFILSILVFTASSDKEKDALINRQKNTINDLNKNIVILKNEIDSLKVQNMEHLDKSN